MKKITILGSTGSIGTQSLDVIRKNRDRFKVEALTCGQNIDLFRKQIAEFNPAIGVCAEMIPKDFRQNFRIQNFCGDLRELMRLQYRNVMWF